MTSAAPGAAALALLALAAALVFQMRFAGDDRIAWPASLVKTASTALLAAIGLLSGAPAAISLGLALGAAGDFALSRAGERWFLAGMMAFALGHLAYAAEFAARVQPGDPALTWRLAAALALVAPLVALVIARIAPRAGALCLPVRLYALVIAAMALAAAAVTPGPGHTLLRVGAAMFVASDLVLALRLFVLAGERARLAAARLLWPLYWGGQALILWGALAAGG